MNGEQQYLQTELSSLNRSQETSSPYSGIEHTELIGMFYESEGDSKIGKELSVRMLEHAGFTGNPITTPLIGRDGKQIREGDRALVVADYINYAAEHHFDALEGILDFLTMRPGEKDYETMRTTIIDRLNANNT